MPPKKRKVNAFAGWEEVFSSLTIEQLKGELIKAGEEVGPIDSSNKDIYVRMLVRKKIKLETEAFPTAASLSTTADSLGIVNPLMRKPLSDSGQGMDLTHAYPAAKGVSSTTSKRPGRKTTTKAQKSNLQSIKDFKLEGLIAATYTPLKDDGELNLPVIKKYIDWLLSSGVKNVFINGTAGESLSLTVEERKLVAEEWHKVSGGRMKIIAHIGTESLKNTCELAKHALDCGIDAIGVMPTTYFKPSSIDNLIMYLQKVADAAPTLPMFYYHIPPMTGINFSMEELLDAASSRLPTLRGLKFTCYNLCDFGRCVINQGGKYQILYGRDEQLLGALILGGTAAVGSTYNFTGKLNNRLLDAYRRKDTEVAKLEQRRSQAVIKLLNKYGPDSGGGKAFMKLCGIDCGPPRLPQLPLTNESLKSLKSDLEDIGFFEWA